MYVVIGLVLSWLMLVLSPLLVYFLGSHGAGLAVLIGVMGPALMRSDGQALMAVWQLMPTVFWKNSNDRAASIEKLVRWSHIYRKEGALALEPELAQETDDYLQACLQALIDGSTLADTKRNLDVLRHSQKRSAYDFARLLSFMSLTSRWIGVSVALVLLLSLLQREDLLVLGLISWLPVFSAVAYGLGLSILFFQPLSERVIVRADHRLEFQVMVADGAMSILVGENSRVMAHRLHSYCE